MTPLTVKSSTLRRVVVRTRILGPAGSGWTSTGLWRGQAFLHLCDEHRQAGARSCDVLVQHHEGDVMSPQPAATTPSIFSTAVLDHKFIIT
jgi:hypothetical protein